MSLFFYKDEGTLGRADALLFSYFAYILNDTLINPLNDHLWSNYGSIMGSFISLYFYKKNGLFI